MPPRSDRQILAHVEDVYLLGETAHGRVRVDPIIRMTLRRRAREDLFLAGFGVDTVPTLLPCREGILAAARGEIPSPLDD